MANINTKSKVKYQKIAAPNHYSSKKIVRKHLVEDLYKTPLYTDKQKCNDTNISKNLLQSEIEKTTKINYQNR